MCNETVVKVLNTVKDQFNRIIKKTSEKDEKEDVSVGEPVPPAPEPVPKDDDLDPYN